MTDTKKSILELIKYYSYIKRVHTKNNWWDIDYYETILPYQEDICFIWRDWCEEYEVIYDITAVLKYMNQCHYICTYKWDFFECSCIWEDIKYFPSKPLYLYTEQEDRDLLNLLLNMR